MAKIIPLSPRPSDADREKLWQEFVAAAEKAQKSLDIRDGLAAGRAWKKFLESFE